MSRPLTAAAVNGLVAAVCAHAGRYVLLRAELVRDGDEVVRLEANLSHEKTDRTALVTVEPESDGGWSAELRVAQYYGGDLPAAPSRWCAGFDPDALMSELLEGI